MKKIFLLFCLLYPFFAMAQTRTIEGMVVDSETGEPLIGATIMPEGIKNPQGTATDIEGKFKLVIPSTVKKIRVSYVGMRTESFNVTSGVMKLELESINSNLDEVMVVAYGTTKKSAYTGSASVVKADQIENTLVTDVTSALNGTVSGVQLQSADGAPGSAPTVRIRGVGSMAASNNPLYVVDGVPFDGNVRSISPNDVESMTVLKDAAAAALYGARGANGVILITTKKGKQGKAKVTIDANWGANSRQVGAYKTIGGPETYYVMMYNALRNYQKYTIGATDIAAHTYANNLVSAEPNQNIFGYQIFTVPNGQGLIGFDGKFNPDATLGYLYTNNVGSYWLTPDNFQKETFTNGFRQEYNAQISGGGDSYDFLLSLNYLTDDGVIRESSFNRFTTRISGNYQITKWLKAGGNVSYTKDTMNYPAYQTEDGSSANAFYLSNFIAPIYPYYVRNAQGQIMMNKDTGYPYYDYGYNGVGEPNLSRAFLGSGNPTGNLVYNIDRGTYNTFDGKWQLIITPLEGLSITGSVGYWYNQYTTNTLESNKYGWSSTYKGYLGQSNGESYSTNVQILADYGKSWGNNNFDFLVGYENYTAEYSSSWASGLNILDDSNYTLANVIDNKDFSGGVTHYGTSGIFGRITYNYDSRYFGMVSYRRDSSSRFAPDKRWGNFYSVSAGWDISKEKFMEDFTNVDMLKFKISFGQQGNDGIGNYYAWLDQYSMTGSDGVWNIATLTYKGNPDLTWETSNAFNTGFDYSFFQGRIEGSLEYFQRTTTNMLYNRPVQPSLGYSSIPQNIGSMRNNGLEFELRTTPVRTRDLEWNVNFNLTYINNKIIKLAPELQGKRIAGDRIYLEGESMYQFYMVKYAGVNEQNGMPLYWGRHADGTEFETEDWNVAYQGDTSTGDLANRCKTGNLLPPVYGGVGTSFSWKGIDLSVSCSYQIGGKVYDYGYAELMHNGTMWGEAMHIDALNAWTPENPKTNVPRMDAYWEYMWAVSDRFLTDASYFAINNINIGYSFPAKWVKKMGLTSLRIYGAADNVALWSKRQGLDPRQSYTTTNAGTYSAMRTISGGLRITF